jgi:carbon storage regulator
MNMLVLSRKIGEFVVINGDIRVTIVSINGSSARLGIEAPREVTVDRAEIHARRQELRDAERAVLQN